MGTGTNIEHILPAQLEIAAAALACSARTVAAVQCLYANLDVSFAFVHATAAEGHHNGLSHDQVNISGSTPNMSTREGYARAQRWFIDMLAQHFLGKLDVPDPADPTGHTVLENTVVLICSEIGEGQSHETGSVNLNAANWNSTALPSYLPLVTIGGGGGSLVTGQRLNFNPIIVEPNGGQVLSGADRKASELWLTLAQAMGVNASDFGGASSTVTEVLA